LTAVEIINRVVDVAGIGLYIGPEFGREGEDFFRMNLACPRSLFERGLQGIEEAFKGS
jgi:cystathionine beta-lyase